MAKLYITDDRMLRLMDWAISEGIAGTESEYLQMINFPRTNISNVRKGLQSFTKEQILNACDITGASADYIFGFSTVMKRKPSRKPIEILKEGIAAMELELKRNVRKSLSG